MKYLKRTFAPVSSWVKSRRVVPGMRTSEKRLHKGHSRKEENEPSSLLRASTSRADPGVHDVSGNVRERVRTPDWL